MKRLSEEDSMAFKPNEDLETFLRNRYRFGC